MQVDWAGDPLYITDSVTGELEPAYIFVAVLPCSWYTYAEACCDMKQERWLLSTSMLFRISAAFPGCSFRTTVRLQQRPTPGMKLC